MSLRCLLGWHRWESQREPDGWLLSKLGCEYRKCLKCLRWQWKMPEYCNANFWQWIHAKRG
jgi:hypothetical protein